MTFVNLNSDSLNFHLKKQLKYTLILTFFSLCFEIRSQNINSVIAFADSLSFLQNYEFALHEYQRAFFFSDPIQKSEIAEKIADCYYVMGNYSKAFQNYDSAFSYSMNDSICMEYAFRKVACLIMKQDFAYALSKVNSLEPGSSIYFKIKKTLYKGICLFGSGYYPEAFESFTSCLEPDDTISHEKLMQIQKKYKSLKRPNPIVVSTMSAILPGSGQSYAGKPGDGFNSLILISGLSYFGFYTSVIDYYIVMPFLYRYYTGGIMNAKHWAEQKKYEKQSYLYKEILSMFDSISMINPYFQKTNNINYSAWLKNSTSETKIIVSFLYLFYKKFISSQDTDACIFYPSCSTYTIEAVEKKGIVIGMLEGFDRLLRCHAFASEHEYPYNKKTEKYEDYY